MGFALGILLESHVGNTRVICMSVVTDCMINSGLLTIMSMESWLEGCLYVYYGYVHSTDAW
jgi:hypothetical protein